MCKERIPMSLYTEMQYLVEMVVINMGKDPEHLLADALDIFQEVRRERQPVLGGENVLIV